MQIAVERAPNSDESAFSILTDFEIGDLQDHLLESYYPSASPGKIPDSLGRILQIAQENGVKSCIVEHGYYDVDFRSEYSLAYSRQASVMFKPDTDRLHLFSASMDASHLWSRTSAEASQVLNDQYIGYVVFRPDKFAPIGRTMLRPPKSQDFTQSPFDEYVRTLVREDVQLASLPLQAVAVPFMEQNRSLLNCATVSAWSVHYSAVLRGIAPRLTTAALWSATTSVAFNHRSYPASSMDTPQLVHLLTLAGLPPETLHAKYFQQEPPKIWFQRHDLNEEIDDVSAMRERLTATVCRYLNSGLPVLLCYDRHVRVACGYLRASDLDKDASSEVAKFIVNDEASGPYVPIDVDDVVGQISNSQYNGVIVPLPDGIFLSDHSAELLGGKALLSAASSGAKGSDLARLHKEMLDGEFAVRTYVADSYDYKMNYVQRCPDPIACRAVSVTRMPEYIWVVEVVNRKARNDAKTTDTVVGEILLDASVPSEYAEALHIKVGTHISGVTETGTSDLYPSGWSDKAGWLHRSVGHKAKTASHRLPPSYGRNV